MAPGGGDMRRAGVVADRQSGRPGQSSEGRNVGAAHEINRLRADITDRVAEILLAMNAHQNGQVTGAPQTLCEATIVLRRPAFGEMTRRRARDQHHKGPARDDRGQRAPTWQPGYDGDWVNAGH